MFPRITFLFLNVSLGLVCGFFFLSSSAGILVEDAELRSVGDEKKTATISMTLKSTESLQLYDAKTAFAIGVRLSNRPLLVPKNISEDVYLTHKFSQESIQIPENETVILNENGAHLRLIGLKPGLSKFKYIPITLYFLDKKAEIKKFDIAVRVNPKK